MTRRTTRRAEPTTIPVPKGVRPVELVRGVDPWMAAAVAGLLLIGTVMVFSATGIPRADPTNLSFGGVARHALTIAVGLVLLAVCLRLPVRVWSRAAYPLLGAMALLLLAVHIPGVGAKINGARRWIALGPLRVQPAEVAKLVVVLYLAHSLAKKRDLASNFAIGFLPHMIVVGLLVGLIILQPDLGSSVLILATSGLMLFVAGTRVGFLLVSALLVLPVVYHYVSTHPHAAARILVFLEPEAYRRDVGYQLWESLVAIGSGGLFGVGLGAGQQTRHFIPESHNDFIMAVIGQELGFLGVATVIILFGILVVRGFLVARRCGYRFGLLLGFGITAWLGLQATVNIAVTMGLLPNKGLTLPFVSFGGSSMVTSLLAAGILLRLSAEQRVVGPLSGGGRRE